MQKAVWWHDNLWSDELTWVSTAMTMFVGVQGMRVRDALVPDTDPGDWVRCVTHLSNRVKEEASGIFLGVYCLASLGSRSR